MDKKKQRKRKLLIWPLCVLLTVTDIIPGTGIYALADGPAMGTSAQPVPDQEKPGNAAEQEAGENAAEASQMSGEEMDGKEETQPGETGETEPDTGTQPGDAGETEPDAGTQPGDAGETEPDAGTQPGDAGETETDAGTQPDETGETESDAGTQPGETEETEPDAGVQTDETEETDKIVTDSNPETKVLASDGTGKTLQIGKSTLLTCTVPVQPDHPNYRNLSPTYDWYADPSENVDLERHVDSKGNKTTCTVTAYKTGEVTVSCRVDWTYEYYDSRVNLWRPNGGHGFQGWKLTVVAGDVYVTFDANGGAVDTSQKKVTCNDVYGTLPVPTKENSTFLGWYTERNGGIEVSSSTKVTKQTNHTLYAHWADHYTVTFDANGGTTPIAEKTVKNTYTYGELPSPEREGFVFDSWYTERTGGSRITPYTIVNLTGPQTLYAHWLDIYVVTFEANGGTTPIVEKNVVNTGTYGSLPVPEREGFVFDGWYTQADGGTQITADSTVSLSGPQTLYAHWLSIYTVTFDANGGKTPIPEKQVVDTQTYGELPEPERDGSVFDGWYTQADGGTQITADSTVSLSGPQTLYAHWLRCYTVTFHALGGQVEPASKAVLYGRNYGVLPVPTREKYEFKGWYTAVQGGTQVTEDTIVDVEASHVLYAKWGFTYTIYFDANGGRVSVESKTVSEDDCYGELPDAERDGYTFAGWYTEPTGGKRILADTSVAARDEQTLYAHWVKNCKVVFDAAGGTGAPSDMVVLEGTQTRLPSGFPTMQWKSFSGWADSYGNIYQPEDTIAVDDDMTLTARWGLNEVSLNQTYSVRIPSAGAAACYLLKCGKETYHTFKCINAKTASGTDMEVRITLYRQTTDSAGNAERTQVASSLGALTEKLDKGAEYIVALEPVSSSQCGGAEFAVLESRVISYYKNESFMNYQKFSTQYADYNVDTGFYEAVISPDKPSREGWWSFIGWTTEPVYDSSGPLYKPEETISVEEDVNLYAVWYSRWQYEESIITKMEISPGKTSSEWYSKKNYTSAVYKFTPDKSARYRFVNATVVTGLDVYIYYSNYNQITSQQTFTSVDVYMDEGVTYYIVMDNQTSGTLYPKIQVRRAYSVTYDANGGTGAPSASYKFEGETLSVSKACPERPFYTFDGWNTMPDGSGTSYASGGTYTADSDLTLYAVWKEERSDDTTTVISGNTCSDNLTADISENGACSYFAFTPDEDGDYRFARTDDGTIADIHMELYDSSGEKLKSDFSYGEKDVCLIDVSLKAGNTYYLKIYAYDRETTGTICLELKRKYKILYEGDGEYCTDTATGDKTGIKYHDTDMELIGADAPDRTVTYKANGGQCEIASAKISYVLEGWKREDTGELLQAGDLFTENIPLTLTAQWKTEVIPESLPQAGRENYTFAGWYTEPEDGTQVTDFSALVFGENITLYAHWIPVSYTVSLDAAGGTVSPRTIDVTYGSAYGELPLATREGYVFEGWYIPRSDGKAWIGSSAIVDQSEEHTLYASWIADEAVHTVIFNAQGRCADPKAYCDIEKGSKIKEPDKPTAEGCTFTGWFRDPECTQKWDFAADTVQEDLTLYAGWLLAAQQVTISGIEMADSVYNGKPASYSGEAVAALQDGTDVTGRVSLTYTYSGTQADGEDYEDTAQAPVNAGDYMLTVSVSGGGKDYTGSAEYPFLIEKAPLNIRADDVFLVLGEQLPDVYQYHVTGLIDGEELLEEPIFTCNAENTETAGEYRIIPSGADAGMNYEIAYQSGVLTVEEQLAVHQISRQTYTGKAVKPVVSVNAADSSTPLKAGKDYTVKYYNNLDADKTDARGGTSGSGTEGENGFTRELPYVVITGKGNYSGSIYQNFHIDAVSIGEKNPAKGFTFKYKNQFVTANKPQRPFQSLKYKKVMKAGTDYGVKLESVTCAEDGTILTRKQVDSGSILPAIPAGAGGTYLMTVKGMGNYRGTIEVFVYVGDKKYLMKNARIILGKNMKSVPYENGNPVTLTASQTAGDNVFAVRFGKAYLDPVNDYTVSYQRNDAVGNATLTVTGKGMYIGTKSISFRITGRAFTAKNITVDGFKNSMTYTGENLQQDRITLKDGGRILVNKEHYDITYKNNKNKGTATVTFTGNPKCGYTGSFKRTFRISAAPFNADAIKVTATDYAVTSVGSGFRLKGESVYTKAGTKPSGRIILTDASGTVLRQGTDYTVSCKIPKNAADAVMTMKGKGNYAGLFSIYYMITKAPLAQNENLTLLSVPIVLNDKRAEDYEYRPRLKITDRQKALSAGKDYAVTAYKNCTQKSALAYLTALKKGASEEELSTLRPCAEIVATAAGNYTGSVTVPVTIYETKLAKKDIRVEIQADTAVFTGEQVKPKVTVYYRNKKLEEKRDYILTYGNNIAAGKNKGSVTVNGTGLYGGSVTQKFTIWGRDIYSARR